MCLDEGSQRTGRDRFHLYRVAAGSAAEVRTALALATTWGYIAQPQDRPGPRASRPRRCYPLARDPSETLSPILTGPGPDSVPDSVSAPAPFSEYQV